MGLILVVSKDVVEIDTIKAALSVHGWWITVAADSATAIQVAADQAPKVVVVDTDVPGSIDLLRSIGTSGGGPGVVACVPEGFEGALELAEAGAEEVLTKPVSPQAVIGALERSLETPPPSAQEVPEAPRHLLTTEEIFGDVLREIEAGDAAAVAPALTETAGLGGSPASAAAEAPFGPNATPEPVVSLAGLFDDDPPAAPVTSLPDAPASVPGVEWQGEERRAAGRPWNGMATGDSDSRSQSEPVSVSDDALPETLAGSGSETQELLAVPVEELFAAAEEPESPVEMAAVPDPDPFLDAEEPGAAPGSEEGGRGRLPWAALAAGALAATLLVGVGVVFVLNRGAAPVPVPVPQSEPAARMEETTTPAAPVAEAPAPAAAPFSDAGSRVAAESPASTAAVGAPDEIEELDLEAIVDEELERREEELRRVFLEEEKRLLRELNNLEPAAPPVESGGESATEGSAGVGR